MPSLSKGRFSGCLKMEMDGRRPMADGRSTTEKGRKELTSREKEWGGARSHMRWRKRRCTRLWGFESEQLIDFEVHHMSRKEGGNGQKVASSLYLMDT
jgi:hypothetical protein